MASDNYNIRKTAFVPLEIDSMNNTNIYQNLLLRQTSESGIRISNISL